MMRSKTGPKLLGAMLLMLCAGHASAICKWKDADGRTQYSDAPPPGGRCEGNIKVQPPISSGTAPAVPQSYQEKDMEFRKRRVEKQEAEKKVEQEKADAETKRKNCESAQNRVAGLARGGRIARYDANGQIYYLGDDDVARELADARKQAEQMCK